MKVILFNINDYRFISKLDNIFKITTINEVSFNNGKFWYKDYNFRDLTPMVRAIINDNYNGEYVILFANDIEQAGLTVQKVGSVMEAEADEFYPLSDDIFKGNRALFKQYYYSKSAKEGAIVFDFTLIK